jgi:hypothetical protein
MWVWNSNSSPLLRGLDKIGFHQPLDKRRPYLYYHAAYPPSRMVPNAVKPATATKAHGNGET